ncbi:unnamed protein product [Mycena citricolor]|uniref:Uncharacterized protein n=1 Tax=Mycena citricolor TaxID=2018698 RepID=A0AAD2HMB4_9AGAR|nr:unnamed protein product [Mycena citricolor]
MRKVTQATIARPRCSLADVTCPPSRCRQGSTIGPARPTGLALEDRPLVQFCRKSRHHDVAGKYQGVVRINSMLRLGFQFIPKCRKCRNPLTCARTNISNLNDDTTHMWPRTHRFSLDPHSRSMCGGQARISMAREFSSSTRTLGCTLLPTAQASRSSAL